MIIASPNTQEPSQLTDHLGYWLRMVSNHVSQAFARRVEDHGVTVAEWVVLRQLHDAEALAPSQLAERLGLSRGAISKLAERLIAKGLAARASHATDGRSHTLSSTPAGRALIPDLAALADENDAEAFGALSPEDRRTLGELLRRIAMARGLSTPPID